MAVFRCSDCGKVLSTELPAHICEPLTKAEFESLLRKSAQPSLPGLYCFSFPLSLRCKSLPFPLGVADSLFAAAQFVAPPPLPDVAPAALAAGSSHRGEMGGT